MGEALRGGFLRAFIEEVQAIDQAFLRRLAGRQAPRWLDLWLRSVTHLGGTASTIGAAALFLAFPETRPLGLVLSLAQLLSHTLVQVLKRTVVRGRPTTQAGAPEALAAAPDAYSFPSGHACASMTTALVLTIAVGSSLGMVLVLLALGVGFSRIYLRVHYATDVLVGQVLGAASALAVVALLPA